MASIELGATSPAGAAAAKWNPRPAIGNVATAVGAKTAPAVVATSVSADPGAPPVDLDRVASIRKAVENGTYPLIPARVADAMIAAGLLLRNAR